jgi:hypothetical protein
MIIDSKNFNFTHLETLREMKTLTNLNLLDCPLVTEPCKYLFMDHYLIELYDFIEKKEGLKVRLLKASGFI